MPLLIRDNKKTGKPDMTPVNDNKAKGNGSNLDPCRALIYNDLTCLVRIQPAGNYPGLT